MRRPTTLTPYRTDTSEGSAMVAAAGNLTVSIVALENSFQTGMQIFAEQEAIPGASSDAGLASMMIEATSEALAAESAQAGHPIDLTTIQPIAII